MISENFSLAQTMALLAKEVDLLAKELIDILAIEMDLFGKKLLDWENIGYYVLAKNNDLLPKTASALVKWQHE